jgi:DNA (cytosine-5)-methyltransferase 1
MSADRKPRLLDAYCCQGGAGMGYHQAGFEVVGIDLQPQPRYPFEFHQGDAIDFIRTYGREFDAIHASPPCQRYSACQRIQGREHPDLIAATRAALRETGRPYVIENVAAARAELHRPVMLCGAMFAMATYRHRLFETGNTPPAAALPHPLHRAPQTKMGRPVKPGEYGQFIGNFSGVDLARRVMGVEWMNRDGIREAIPPAYTRHIGAQLLAYLTAPGEAAA